LPPLDRPSAGLAGKPRGHIAVKRYFDSMNGQDFFAQWYLGSWQPMPTGRIYGIEEMHD